MTVARTRSVLAVLVAVGVAACSGAPVATSSVAASSVVIDVTPPTAAVGHRQSVQLNATVTGTAVSAVTWAADCGSITQTGLFTAPGSDAVCNVVARPEADTTKSASATVTVSASVPLVGASAPVLGWSAKCAAEPMRTTGTMYYACDCGPGAAQGCTVGNDSNAGTDPNRPLRSLEKVTQLFRSMPAGSTMALCKGGVFNPSQGNNYANTSCGATPSTTCILRDYDPHCAGPSCVNVWGTGAEPKPAIVATSTGVGGVQLLGNTQGQGIRFLNLRFATTLSPSSSTSDAFVLSGAWTDVEICNNELDNWGTGIEANGGNCGASPNGLGNRWYVRGNRITNSCSFGLLVEANNLEVDGNYFYNNAHDACASYNHIINPNGGTTHTFYWAGWCGGTGLKFINNEVHRNAYYNGGSNGSPINIIGGYNAIIENNLLDFYPAASPINEATQYCGAIFARKYYAAKGPDNIVVRRNRIIAERGLMIGISESQNPIVEDNVITIDASNSGVSDAVIRIPGGNESIPTTGATVRNNTIHVNSAAGSWNGGISGVNVANTGASFAAPYNVTGNSVTYVGSYTGSCYQVDDLSALRYMNNNHCYGTARFGATGGSGYLLSAWQTLTGFDVNSITSAPQFVKASTDFTPTSESSLIGAGSTATNCTVGGVANQPCSSPIGIGSAAWSATDVAKSRSAPDIGAYAR